MYNQRSGWNIALAVFGIGILLVTLFYSNYLANKLKESEEKDKQLFIQATRFIADNTNDYNADIRILSDIQQSFALPAIVEFNDGTFEALNWGEERNNDEKFIREKIDKFLDSGKVPEDYPAGEGKIYFFDSNLVQLIRLYPLVQVLLVGLFIALG